jgi:cytochrome c peroxidase
MAIRIARHYQWLSLGLTPNGPSMIATRLVNSHLVRILGAAALTGAVMYVAEAGPIAADNAAATVPVWSLPVGLPPSPLSVGDSPSLIRYGAFLFGSPLLSRDGSLSCASCHDPTLAFSGPEPQAVGIGGAKLPRHAPALINLYTASTLMWDGRAPNLEEQIHLPLEAPNEMDIGWPASIARLAGAPQTREFLTDNPGTEFDRSVVLSALAAYVRSLVSGESPFDRFFYLGQKDAISPLAAEGLTVFVRKARCSSCHLVSGEAAPLTDGNFHSVGVGFHDGNYADDGRYDVTGLEADRGMFKTPTLRNVAERRYFMHDGSLKSLGEVVDYYNRGGNRSAPNLDARIRPLFLTSQERDALIDFLKTLTSPVEGQTTP